MELIAAWTLTGEHTTYEEETTLAQWTDYATPQGMNFDFLTRRRPISTRTYEATISDAETSIPPPYSNPGNLSTPWRLQDLDYSCALSQPLSRRVRETWGMEGEWQIIAVEPGTSPSLPAGQRYNVAGAGTTAANGLYKYGGTEAGYPFWLNGQGFRLGYSSAYDRYEIGAIGQTTWYYCATITGQYSTSIPGEAAPLVSLFSYF